jgi:DNA-binding XRE family transcriptional regulator
VNKKEFSQIRRDLGKTQKQMAQLLGTSLKAIQSFEQGWRDIPLPAERQALFLMALKSFQNKSTRPCWVMKRCSEKTRQECPAWEFQAGHLCWFINGTFCGGKVQKSWQGKMEICRQCTVFVSLFSPTPGRKGGEGNG